MMTAIACWETKYYVEDSWVLTETITNTFVEGELDTQTVVYTEADPKRRRGEDWAMQSPRAMQPVGHHSHLVRCRWGRCPIWRMDLRADGNTLTGRLWFDEDEIIEEYEYDFDGNMTLYYYYSTVRRGHRIGRDPAMMDGNTANGPIDSDDEIYGQTLATMTRSLAASLRQLRLGLTDPMTAPEPAYDKGCGRMKPNWRTFPQAKPCRQYGDYICETVLTCDGSDTLPHTGWAMANAIPGCTGSTISMVETVQKLISSKTMANGSTALGWRWRMRCRPRL